MIACCGLDCTQCEAFIATATNDDTLRAKVAGEWTKAYNVDIQTDDINCTGCHSSGVKVLFCERMCAVRKCALSRGYTTCAPCGDFPCNHLETIFKFAPHAENTLKSLRKC
jgi:hypothetical protein